MDPSWLGPHQFYSTTLAPCSSMRHAVLRLMHSRHERRTPCRMMGKFGSPWVELPFRSRKLDMHFQYSFLALLRKVDEIIRKGVTPPRLSCSLSFVKWHVRTRNWLVVCPDDEPRI